MSRRFGERRLGGGHYTNRNGKVYSHGSDRFVGRVVSAARPGQSDPCDLSPGCDRGIQAVCFQRIRPVQEVVLVAQLVGDVLERLVQVLDA